MSNFKSLFGLLKSNPTEQDCIDYFEKLRWNGKVVSLFDPNSKVYKCSNNRYKCKNTGKYFNAKTGTVFRNSKISLLNWFWTLCFFSSDKKGVSSCQLARYIGITQKSAWFVLHRSRHAFKSPIFKTILNGSVEIDETFIGGKNKNRHWNKKVPNSQGRSCKDKIPFLGIYGRDSGNLMIYAVPNTKKKTIRLIIESNIKKGINVNTDEFTAYNNLSEWGFNHYKVNHGDKEYAKGKSHTNSIENGWSRFKRSFNHYYHISRKHSQGYANEFTFRSNTSEFGIQEKFDLALLSLFNKKSTCQQLIS